jgi:hypothetical protein
LGACFLSVLWLGKACSRKIWATFYTEKNSSIHFGENKLKLGFILGDFFVKNYLATLLVDKEI